MKKNNIIKRTMAGALAMVSVAAYVPVSAAVPVLSNVAMVAEAANTYSSGNAYYYNDNGGATIAAGDILKEGVTITRSQASNGRYYEVYVDGTLVDGDPANYYSSYFCVKGNGNGSSRLYTTDKDYEVVSVSNADAGQYSSATIRLKSINTATVTLPEGARIAGVSPTNEVYTLAESKTYSITSDKTLTESSDYITLSSPTKEDGVYKYTLTVSALNADITDPIEITHAHSVSVNGVKNINDQAGKQHNGIVVKCGGEIDFHDLQVAELEVSTDENESIYYYGDAPKKEDVLTIDEETAAEYGVDLEEQDFYYKLKGGNGAHIAPEDLEVGKIYTAVAVINADIEETGTSIPFYLEDDFQYAPRPLSECKVYFKTSAASETLTELEVSDAGVITIPFNTYEYDETEHSPVIIIKQVIGDEEVVVDSYVVDTTEEPPAGATYKVASKAINAGEYRFTLNADKEKADNYSGKLDVSWSISPANCNITITPNASIVYDGEPVKWNEDFTISGENASLLTNAAGEETTDIELVPATDGDTLTNAGTHGASIRFKNSNYGDGVINIPFTFTIARREVTLTPDADQTITYGDLYTDKVAYTVEEQSGNRGFIAGDLSEGQTEAEFFGEQFKVNSRIDNEAHTAFNYNIRTNHAGQYDFVKNTGATGAQGDLNNYSITWVTETQASEPIIFTIDRKEITADMFFFSQSNGGSGDDHSEFTYREDADGEGVVQTPLYAYVENVLDVGAYDGGTDKRIWRDVDYTLGGTTEAIFPGLFHVEIEGKDNYKGFTYLPWTIDVNKNFAFNVEATGFTYSGKTIEEEGKLTINKPYYGGKTLDVTNKCEYFAVTNKNGSDDMGDWELEKLDASPTEAGEYIVKVYAERKGYEIDPVSEYYKISERGVTLIPSADSLSKVFGDPDPTIDYTFELVGEIEEGKKVEVKGTVEIGTNTTTGEAYDKNAGKYNLDLSNVKVYVDGKEDKSFAVNVAADKNTFTVKRRPLKDSDIYGDDAFFDENGEIVVPKCFTVRSLDADGNEAELELGKDYRLVTGEEAKVENHEFEIQVAGLGNYTSAAEANIKVGASYQVTLNGGTFTTGKAIGGSEAKFYKDDIVSIKPNPDAIPEGKRFAYWTNDKGVTVYNEKVSFKVDRNNITYTANYVDATDEIESFAKANFGGAELITESGKKKISAVANFSVPDGYTIKKAGFVASSDPTIAETKALDVNTAGAVVKTDSGITAHNYDYTLKIGSNLDKTWYLRPYLVCEKDGVEKSMYGKLVSVAVDGTDVKSDVLEDEEIQTTIHSYASNLINEDNVDKAKFEATFVIPPDCTMKRAGFLLANSKLSEENFVVGNAGVKIDYTSANTSEPVITAHTYKFTLKKKRDVNTALTWYARAYMVFESSNGKEYTVYGDYNDIMEKTIPAKA